MILRAHESRIQFFQLALDRATACEQVDDQNNERDHEQQVNETTADSANSTDQPKNKKHHQDCPQHIAFSFCL